MITYGLRYRGTSEILPQTLMGNWKLLHSVARISRDRFETYVLHNGSWREVL